jgi:hypothetical protein
MAKDPSKDAAARAKKRVDAAGYLTEIADGSVTLAKLADIQTNSFLGRHSAGTGEVERLSPGNARNILNVENGATNTNDPLADANQTMTASRTIDDGDNGYSFFVDLNAGGGDTCQFLLNPATPSATWKAQSGGTDAVTLLNTGVRLNMLFTGSADLALDSDPGAAGECITSTGSGSAPVFQGFPIISSATAPTNTSLYWFDTGLTNPELFFYDSTRSKWLSVAIYFANFGRGGSVTASHYMRGPGGFDYNTASEVGVPLKFDATVVGAWGSIPGGGTSGWTKRVMKYDDSAGSNGVAGTYAPAGTYNRWEKLDFDIDYDAEDLIGLNIFDGGSATSIENHTAVVAYRRRTS